VTAYLAVLLAAAGSYALRIGSVHLAGRRHLTARVEAGLRHAALAMLVALAAIGIPRSGGGLGVTPPVAVAVAAAVVVAHRKGDLVIVVVAAMVAHEVVRFVA